MIHQPSVPAEFRSTYSFRVSLDRIFEWRPPSPHQYMSIDDIAMDVFDSAYHVHISVDGIRLLDINALAFKFRAVPLHGHCDRDHPLSILVEFEKDGSAGGVPSFTPPFWMVVTGVGQLRPSDPFRGGRLPL